MSSSDSAVTTVLFDLDDTICTYRRSHDEVLALAFDVAGVEPFFDVTDWSTAIQEVTDGETQAEFRRNCFELVAERKGRDPEYGRVVADAYDQERDYSAVEFLPGAQSAVSSISADHRVGLVTNGAPEAQREKLAALALEDTFETVVYAGKDTAPKPAPEPFEVALGAMDAATETSVYVGNSLASDVAGAHAVGLDVAWLSNGSVPDPEPTYVLDSMGDLSVPPWC